MTDLLKLQQTDISGTLRDVTGSLQELVQTEVTNAQEYANALAGFVAESAEDLEPINELIASSRKRSSDLQKKRTEFLAPLKKDIKAFEDTIRIATKEWDHVDAMATNIRAEYDRKQLAIRQEAARKAQELVKAQVVDVEAIRDAAVAAIVTSPKTGPISAIQVWDVVITDKTLVPEEYKIIDTAALQKAARESKGTLSVPGVKFEENVAYRSKGR